MAAAYDFRIPEKAADKAGVMTDRLPDNISAELSATAGELQQKQEEHLSKAKKYFQAAVLPGLKDFAEMSGSILYINEHDETMSMQAVFKNVSGFDITESCRLMRSLMLLSNHIGIMTEDSETTLSLVYDYKELIDY